MFVCMCVGVHMYVCVTRRMFELDIIRRGADQILKRLRGSILIRCVDRTISTVLFMARVSVGSR